MKDIDTILTDFDRDWNAHVEQNDKCVEDQRFVDVDGAQWEGECGDRMGGKVKLQFDKVTRELNRIIGEYNSNPVTVKFLPNDEDAETELADVLQDRFRNDSRKSDGQEAGDVAFSESVKGGYGAFRLNPTYEDEFNPDKEKQFISIEPIQSASTVVVVDADAQRFDKSDAEHQYILHEFTRHKFDQKYPGKAPFPTRLDGGSNYGYSGYDFQWYGKDVVYVAEYFQVIENKVTRLVFERPDGSEVKILKSELKDDDIAFEFSFYEQVSSERITDRYIERAMLCGDSFLEEPERLAGKFIPIIHFYGYRSYIQGKEYYMGEVRKQRDRQTFNNMAVSMLAQIMTESQREKDIVAPEQMTPELMEQWATDNINNYPVLQLNPIRDASGNITHAGPVGKTSAPQVPPAMVAAMSMINQDMAEELGNGDLQIPANTSGSAIQQVQERADMSYFILLHNARKSWRHAGKVWLEMAKDLYGVDRALRTISEDGSVNMVQMQEADFSSGFHEVKNDINKGSFEVITETGPAYSTKKEAERATISQAMAVTDSTNPMYQFLFTELLQTMDGEGSSLTRKVAKIQQLEYLLSIDPQLAVSEAKTDEEKQFVMQAFEKMQQPPQQDPLVMIAAQDSETKNIIAQTGQLKAQTDQQALQISAMSTQSKISTDQAGVSVNMFKAETDRMNAQVNAQETGATINNKQMDTMNKAVDAQLKQADLAEKQLQNQLKSMPTEELIRLMGA